MISVVMPVYNEEKNILKALDALYSNTVLPDEVIVTDGGSTDRTAPLIRKYYPQVILISNSRKNAASGRNIGI